MSNDENEYEFSGGSIIEQDVDISECELSTSSNESNVIWSSMMHANCRYAPPMFLFVVKSKINFLKENDNTILDYFNLSE